MPNVNVQAIAFTNTKARPTADIIYSAYLTAKKIVQDWNSQSVSSVIPNDATLISDGSATDGRNQVTNANVTSVITRAQEFINWMERGTLDGSGTQNFAFLGTITLPAVNGQSKY
jgi:hypothetical protein